MKIVCDSCQAKYSIADEKVRGKVFKIRCKKCSNIIVVKGTGEGAEQPPAAGFDQKETRVFDYSGHQDPEAAAAAVESVWHLVIDQEQIGPMTAAEVRQRFSRGEIDAETYIWREGFADWLPLTQVEGFTDLAGGAPAAAPAEDHGGMFGGPAIDEPAAARSDPADLFAAGGGADVGADEDQGGDLFGTPAAAAAGGSMADSLFGGAPARGGNGASAAAQAQAEAAQTAEQRLRGQRNENSVLFSLGNLAALATGDRPGASSSSSSSSSSGSGSGSLGLSASGGMAQHGGGEGSGLIDIRSMAGAYLGGQSGRAGVAPGRPADDDLPVFSPTSFDAAPAVLLPTAAPSAGANNKVLYALFGVIALLMIVAVVLLFVVFKSKSGSDSDKTQVASGQAGDGDKGSGDKGSGDPAAKPGAGDTDTTATGGDTTATGGDPGGTTPTGGVTPATGAKDPPKDPPKDPRKDPRKDPPRDPRKDPPRDPRKDPPKAPPPPADTGGKCLDEVACLLADNPPACCKKYKGGGGGGGGGDKPKGGGADPNLPEKLTREDISSGIGGVRDRVLACGDKSSAKGTVSVKVKVSGSGSVSSASVASSPDGALGSCVASAVKKARFKQTQSGGSFTYPFVIR